MDSTKKFVEIVAVDVAAVIWPIWTTRNAACFDSWADLQLKEVASEFFNKRVGELR